MKADNLYAYMIAPMDFGWGHLITDDEYVDKIIAEEKANLDEGYGHDTFGQGVRDFHAFRDAALKAAKQVGWEGDYRIGPMVGFLPNRDAPRPYLIWKQDNNGDTFVVSSVELPYLGDQY